MTIETLLELRICSMSVRPMYKKMVCHIPKSVDDPGRDWIGALRFPLADEDPASFSGKV